VHISSVGRASRALIWHICISRDEIVISRDELDISRDEVITSCATVAAPSLPISGALATSSSSLLALFFLPRGAAAGGSPSSINASARGATSVGARGEDGCRRGEEGGSLSPTSRLAMY